MNDITSQGEGFVECENKKVLDVATGNNESESESHYEPSDTESDDSLEVNISSTTSSQMQSPADGTWQPSLQSIQNHSSESTAASSKPAKATASSTKVAEQQISSSQPVKSKKNVETKKVPRVKKPVDAVSLAVRNIELFKRNLEAIQKI